MESNYGKSPLVAFCEVIENQRIAHEFHRKLFVKTMSNMMQPKKPINFVNKFKILPVDTELEGLPMGDYTQDILNAFRVDAEQFELKLRML